MKHETRNKIIIIGAGLSGLAAADQLLAKNPNFQVIVLEAMDRVGGKTYTKQILGTQFDLGAQFIGKSQKHVIQLAIRCNQEFVPEIYKGSKVLYLNGKRSTYNSNIPKNMNILALIQMQWVIWKINKMAKKVPLLDPKNCQMANYWDSITVQTWMENNLWSEKVRLMFTTAVRILLGSQPSQVSFLYFLWFVHQNQSFDNLVNIQDGLQQKKLKNGTQPLSLFLRDEIQKRSGKIHLNQYVREIVQKDGIVEVITREGKNFAANYLILATAPSLYRNIQFIPNLSAQKRYMAEKYQMGNLTKVVVLYDKQYWKEKGYSGEIVSDSFDDPILSCFDDTKLDDDGNIKQPALIVFVGAQVYRYWKQRGDMGERVCEKLSQAFECEELNKPLAIEWFEFDEQPTIGGGPVSIMGPGGLSHIQNLRKSQGKIYFAGTEMATVSIGYMDGAIESGIRAANEVWDKIKNSGESLQVELNKVRKHELPWYNKLIRRTKHFFEWI